jgi:RHS repeat-associated protein
MQYGYNDLNRLTSYSDSESGSDSYVYDANGNITSFDGRSFLYESKNNRMTKDGSSSYGFDTIGRVTNAVGSTVTYDLFSSMKTHGTNSYSYDSFGQRIKKTENSVATYYITSGEQVLSEYDNGNNLKAEYIYAAGRMVTKYDPDQGYLWFYTDHLGSTRLVDGSDSTGQKDMSRDYYPYGEALRVIGSNHTAYQFSGKELDSGIGLYYFGARYYNPAIGRWYVPDPAGQGWSPYGYCGNSPLNYVDPHGEFAVIPFLIQAYKIYSITKTAYSMYQAYQTGGWGAVFQAAVVGVISYGAGEIAGGIAGDAIPLSFAGDLATGAVKGGSSSALGAYMTGENVGESALSGAGWGAACMGLEHLAIRSRIQLQGGNDDKALQGRVASFINRHRHDMAKYAKNVTDFVQNQNNFETYLSDIYSTVTADNAIGYTDFLKKGLNTSDDNIIEQKWINAAYKTKLYKAYPRLSQIIQRHGVSYLGKIYLNPLKGYEISSVLAHEYVHAVPYNLFRLQFSSEGFYFISPTPIYLPKY